MYLTMKLLCSHIQHTIYIIKLKSENHIKSFTERQSYRENLSLIIIKKQRMLMLLVEEKVGEGEMEEEKSNII